MQTSNSLNYWLTKGQYCPTSEVDEVTKSTPMRSIDNPFKPVSLALGAEAKVVARTFDSDRTHLTEILRAAATPRGTSPVEIYENCPIFNDDSFNGIKVSDSKADAIIPLRQGEPIRFGKPSADGAAPLGVFRDPVSGNIELRTVTPANEAGVLIHDAHVENPSTAFVLSRLTEFGTLTRAPIGIFREGATRDVRRPHARPNRIRHAHPWQWRSAEPDRRQQRLVGRLHASTQGPRSHRVGGTPKPTESSTARRSS